MKLDSSKKPNPFSLLAITATLILSSLFASAQLEAADPKPLPYPKVIKSQKISADNVVEKMYVNSAYESAHPDKVISDKDLLEVELKALARFVRTGESANKEIYLVRYGISDPRVFDLLIEAKNRKIPVTLIVDVNRALEFTFAADQKLTVDFDKATFQAGGMGPGLQNLVESGFQWNKGDFRILSQPLFNRNLVEMMPIMHEKGLLLKEGTKLKLFRGTANLSDRARYNRIFEYSDPEFIGVYLEHYQATADNFARGGKIRDIADLLPTRILYKDGSSVEIAFTDGKYNPNDRINNLLKRARVSPGFEIESITMTHFAFTNKNFTTQLRALNKLGKRPKILGIFDSKFSRVDGYGQAPIIQGFDTTPEWGNSGKGFDFETNKNHELYIYQKNAYDHSTGKKIPELSVEGEPVARDLMHDKSTLVITRESGVRRAYFFNGSLNLSLHFDNADEQVMYTLSPDSWIVTEYEKSVKALIRDHPNDVVDFSLGEIRILIGSIAGRSELEIPLDSAKRMKRAVHSGNAKEIGDILRDAAKIQSTLQVRPSAENIDLGIDRVQRFLGWYFIYDKTERKTPFDALTRMRRIAPVIQKLATFEQNGFAFIRQLNKLAWAPRLTMEAVSGKQQKAVNAAWRVIGAKGKPPLVSVTGSAVYSGAKQNLKAVIGNFDWDDNLIFMPTTTRLFRKPGSDANIPEVRDLTTGDFALLRDTIGKSGELEPYEIIVNESQNSFERFQTPNQGMQRNYPLEEVKQLIDDGKWEESKGPAWVALEYLTKSAESAQNVSIVTARRHDPIDLYETILYLVQMGYLKNSIPLENIHCVGATENPAQAKADLLVKQFRSLRYKKVSEKWETSMNPNGDGTGQYHIWTFSDDDWGNYVAVRNMISAEMGKGRILNTKAVLFYTGQNHPEHLPEAMVIKTNGSLRPLIPNEEQDIAKILKLDGSDCSDLLRYGPKPLVTQTRFRQSSHGFKLYAIQSP